MGQTRAPSAGASGLDWRGARFEADEARILILPDINSQSSACVHLGDASLADKRGRGRSLDCERGRLPNVLEPAGHAVQFRLSRERYSPAAQAPHDSRWTPLY